MTLEDVQHFIPSFINSIHVEWLICGNLTTVDARQLVSEVESLLTVKKVPSFPQALPRQVKLRKGTLYICQKPEPNPDEVNSAVFNSYQVLTLAQVEISIWN